MGLVLYNNINKFISTLIKTSRFWDVTKNYKFEYRWGYQPIIPKIDQNHPYFFAWIRNIRSKNVTPINRCNLDINEENFTINIDQNNELEIELVFRQQRSVDEYLNPPMFEDQTWDGSLILSQIVAGMWNNETRVAANEANVGFIRPGLINNHSEIVSKRYVREFSVSLFFDTIQPLEYETGILQKVYIAGADEATTTNFDFIVESPKL